MISNNFDMYIKISYFYNFVFKIIGEMGIVAGWGRLSEGGQLPSILQYVSIYRTHTNSAPGYYFHARHLGGLVIEFSARDL